MNGIINNSLLAEDKFMPKMHLKQPSVFNKNKKQPCFTYSACGPFTKNKQSIQRFLETGDTNYIYKNEGFLSTLYGLWRF